MHLFKKYKTFMNMIANIYIIARILFNITFEAQELTAYKSNTALTVHNF